MYAKDKYLIALTHVCHAWREQFTSRASLWVDIECKVMDKTLVYLEHSKPSPIDVSLDRSKELHSNDPFIQIIPHSIGQLKSLSIYGVPGIYKTSLLAYLSPLPSSRSCGYLVPPNPRHWIMTQSSRLHSSTKTSPHCASYVYSPFSPSYLGGAWSTSRGSNWLRRRQSPLNNFSTSLKLLLASVKSNSATRPQPLVLERGGWCHWRV